MAMGSGLLALALLAADGPSCPPDETTTFQVRVLTIDGLDWRTTSYSRLTPVTRQGTSAIWTADKSLATVLADRASAEMPGCKIVSNTGEAVFSRAEPVSYVAAMERVADGPINQSTAIAFMPRPERVDERFTISLVGRRLDQGVLTKVILEETHVDALHSVVQTEMLRVEPTPADRTATEIGRDAVKSIVCRTSTDSTTSITGSVQIPEVSQTRIDGEWLIPKDGVLLISLGVKTAADDEGKAVVRERVALIEAVPTSPFAPSPMNAAPLSSMTMPPTPLRSMPVAVDVNGTVTDLPPLPEAVASADLDRIKPAPNQPSPQTLTIPGAVPDPSLARTSYELAAVASNPPAADVVEGTSEARMARLRKLQEALAKAGFDLEMSPVENRETNEIKRSRTVCEKCDGDSLFCPAEGKSSENPTVAGGMKLVAERAGSIGLTVKVTEGGNIIDSYATLSEALKNPGKTETTLIPVGERVSLEIKATLVPNTNETARKVGASIIK
jgi:hypothetical protein